MAVTRRFDLCWLYTPSCALVGAFHDIPASGCVPAFGAWPFQWSKAVITLTGPEQTLVANVRAFLQAKVDALEPCVDLRPTLGFQFALNSDDTVKDVHQYWAGPTIAGKVRPGQWGVFMERAAFTAPQQQDLDDVVAMLIAHLETEEPL